MEGVSGWRKRRRRRVLFDSFPGLVLATLCFIGPVAGFFWPPNHETPRVYRFNGSNIVEVKTKKKHIGLSMGEGTI